GGLGNERHGPGCTRIHLQDEDHPVLNRELNVHQPDDPERAGEFHRLPLDFGDHRAAQTVRRQRAGAVSLMDPGLLDVFHDAGDLDYPTVGYGIDIDLDRVLQITVDQHRAGPGHQDGVADVAMEPGGVVYDLHRSAAEHIRRADDDGIPDIESNRFRLARRI